LTTKKTIATTKCNHCGKVFKKNDLPIHASTTSYAHSIELKIGNHSFMCDDLDFCDEKCFCEYFTEKILEMKNGS